MSLSIFRVALTAAIFALPAYGAGTPTEAVKVAIEKSFEELQKAHPSNQALVDSVRKSLEDYVDYALLTRRALGANWVNKSFTEDQKNEFIKEFGDHVTRTYLETIKGHSADEVRYDKERVVKDDKGDFAEVQTTVKSTKGDTKVDYRLLKVKGKWKVYDIVVGGVSHVNNYRAQFDKILKDGSLRDLADQLKANNEKNAAKNDQENN